MSYSDLSIYEKLLRTIRDRRNLLAENLLHGSVSDFVVFKEQRARLNELELLEQELKTLLDKMVQND
jgi:hypothetical protein